MAKSELHMNLKYASKDVAIAEIKRVAGNGEIATTLDYGFEAYGADAYSFHNGVEYGYITALMQIFDISHKEID